MKDLWGHIDSGALYSLLNSPELQLPNLFKVSIKPSVWSCFKDQIKLCQHLTHCFAHSKCSVNCY